ncbi:MAG: hypothetical protein JNJ60_10790 [Rhodocyclaceae bacterium]|nr:hypothetical protein [Rhodocyclaceae bacterium]
MDRRSEPAALIDLIGACWTTQALYVAADLGLADLLAQQPASAEQLAACTRSHPDALRRLLRALVSLGLCAEGADGLYALTPAGQPLRKDVPASLHALAIWWGRYCWPEMQGLGESVRTGASARTLANGGGAYARLAQDGDAAAVFHRAMRSRTRLMAQALARRLDVSDCRCVLDLGGGEGELIAALLLAHPHLRGMLLDRPHALCGAKTFLAQLGLEARCELLAGDFFVSVPPGADLVVLKSVLHNWDDDQAARILANCWLALRPGARLLVIERVLPPRMHSSGACRAAMRADLNMLVGPGGRERDEHEFRALLQCAGLAVQTLLPLDAELSVITASAV